MAWYMSGCVNMGSSISLCLQRARNEPRQAAMGAWRAGLAASPVALCSGGAAQPARTSILQAAAGLPVVPRGTAAHQEQHGAGR